MSTVYKDVVGSNYAGELAYSKGYVKPLKFKLTIKSADETEILHIYDSFAIRRANNISLQTVAVTQGLGLAGSAYIKVNDSRDRIINPNKVDNGAVVIIEAGKTAESLQRIFYGIVADREIERNTDRIFRYNLDCVGFGSILSHTHVNFQRIAPPRDLAATNPALNMEKQYDTTDVKYMAHQIVKDLFTDKLIMPFGGATVQERGHFTLNNIKTNVIDFIPTLSYPIVVVAEILKNIEKMTGTIAIVDEDGDVNFMYPSNLISGHVIRGDFDPADLGVGDWTSYSNGEWRFKDSIAQSNGFANHLIMKAEKVDYTGGSIRFVGSTSTYNKDLAQKLDVTTSLFSNMSLVMYKSGGGTNEDNPAKAYLNGAIVEDIGNTPTGALVATFRIPLKNIPLSPAPIPKIVMQFRQPVNVSKQHWCIIFEKGSGDVETGAEDNTCYWCHNDDFDTANQWSAIRPLQYGRINGDPFSNVGWRVRNKGPKYSHGLAVVSTILCEMKDPRSIRKWTPNRPVEELVPTLTGASVQTAMLMLGHRIKFSARKRRTWNYNRVTIPNRLFKVGSFVRIRDENTPLLKKSMNVYAQIREIAYNASVDSDDMRGNCFCGVLPVQYVRPREEITI